ncbi:hypothetical protein [Nocardia otitidiscaviarum]|uniref:hypothetical protein n=1 Tax=Nocardia otitidiscaviarum TaxID=1823 RepID=UPI0004A77267|nr:hypothetical protein [Nocardia otitidiscaviarum]
MTTTENLTLRQLIASVLDETNLSDPREVAEKTAALIPPEQQLQILTDVLVGRVREMMAERRNAALSNAFKPRPHEPVTGGSIQVSPKCPPRRPSGRSAKVDQIRDWWADLLASSIHVGDQRWMPLGQCGIDELLFAEQTRRDKAAKEVARAKQYMRLRELLDKYEVATVAELPADAAKAAWS